MSCYVIFSLFPGQAMEAFMITYWQDVTKPRENDNFKLEIAKSYIIEQIIQLPNLNTILRNNGYSYC